MTDYCVYILECKDGSLYCGVTKDIERRLHEHNKTKKAAKYTMKRRPVVLLHSTEYKYSLSEAMKLERKIKKSTKGDKLKKLQEA